MLDKLKQLLLQQYIGAIVTALIVVDALRALLSLVLNPVLLFLSTLTQTSRDVFGYPQKPAWDWKLFLSPLAELVVYSAAAYFLIRWLYWKEAEPVTSMSTDEQSDAGNE